VCSKRSSSRRSPTSADARSSFGKRF
jgi:hypothetical protein